MSEAQNNKDVYKIYNNAHYQLLDKKENFSLIVNKALGKKATTPSTLHSCDSREIALLIEATEKTIKENEENEVVIKSLINLSKEVTRMGNYDKDGGCSIIFFASIMGLVGDKCKTLYSATKGALIAAARSMACELAKNKIRVNVVSPGAIETPINKNLPHMADPELRKELEEKHLLGLGECSDISNACIYLLSDAARWVTGQNLIVDGGYTAR